MKMTINVTINDFGYKYSGGISDTKIKLDEFKYDLSYECTEEETKEFVEGFPKIFSEIVNGIKDSMEVSSSFHLPKSKSSKEEKKSSIDIDDDKW